MGTVARGPQGHTGRLAWQSGEESVAKMCVSGPAAALNSLYGTD